MRKKGCGGFYREDRGTEKGRHWNVEVFFSYVFKDACFPLQCDDRIKIKTSSSNAEVPVAQNFYQVTCNSDMTAPPLATPVLSTVHTKPGITPSIRVPV